jgi:acetamidase/formamidase
VSEHTWPAERIHHVWDLSLEPPLTIASGDTVHYDIPMSGEGQVEFGASYAETSFDFDTIYNLAGPLRVEGAEPGDTLRIEILRLEPGDWGWASFLPELGLLPEEFPDGYVRTFELAGRGSVDFGHGIRIPISPFFGTMGNHPGEPAWGLPFPPHRGGGNMDTRHLTAGSTLWLPVWCEGALFSVGDSHACQGDGEVCVTGLECAMRASLRFTVEKRTIPVPSFRNPPGSLTPGTDPRGYHTTMGIGGDLMECSRDAVRAMIAWLGERHGLSSEDAYVLCSLVGDLKILEIVDAGVWNVGFTMPLFDTTGGER